MTLTGLSRKSIAASAVSTLCTENRNNGGQSAMTHKNTVRLLAAFIVTLLMLTLVLPFGVFADDASPDSTVAADAGSTDTTAPADTADKADDKKESKLGTGFWVSMGVLGVLIIVGVVLAIVRREKLKVWLKSYKSELKKIVWMPWRDVKKNTVVVIVVVIAISIVIGLLDFAFSKGIIALGDLISL